MIPIPRSLLMHAAALQEAKSDTYQKRTYTELASLTRVRVETGGRQIVAKDGSQKRLDAVLFFDCRNSLPEGTTFEEGQYVLYDGREYRIESVDKLIDRRKPHHFEVGLCG